MTSTPGAHSQSFAIPEIAPLKRLSVRNGLHIDAERWQVAHHYHQQRQNLHYQALHSPGIVCGLEVSTIAPPEDVSARYRDGRWLQINSGMAIDAQGNVIVIEHPVHFHIASITDGQPHWVYLVVQYVDPDLLKNAQSAEIVAEAFRLDEQKTLPRPLEIEVCRFLLPPGEVTLRPAQDVFSPGLGELDMRYRLQARNRPPAMVNVAFVSTGLVDEDARIRRSLNTLLNATTSLYPALTGSADIAEVSFNHQPLLHSYDLLYITHRQCLNLTDSEMNVLKQQLDRGGVVLVELPSRDGNFEKLGTVARELTAAIDDLQGSERFSDLKEQLSEELTAVRAVLESRLKMTQQGLLNQFSRMGMAGLSLSEPDNDHPLRRSPFAFSQWPAIHTQEPLQLFTAQGLVFVVGDLAQAWEASPNIALTRERIRAVHELGINLLQFAWQRHHWSLAQSSS